MGYQKDWLSKWLGRAPGATAPSETEDADGAPRFGQYGRIVSGLPGCPEAAPMSEDHAR